MMKQRLIDANQIPFSSTTWGVIATPLMIDSVPTVDAIPRERIDAMVADIESLFLAEIHSDIDLGMHLGLSQVLSLIQKYIKEQNNENDN